MEVSCLACHKGSIVFDIKDYLLGLHSECFYCRAERKLTEAEGKKLVLQRLEDIEHRLAILEGAL